MFMRSKYEMSDDKVFRVTKQIVDAVGDCANPLTKIEQLADGNREIEKYVAQLEDHIDRISRLNEEIMKLTK